MNLLKLSKEFVDRMKAGDTFTNLEVVNILARYHVVKNDILVNIINVTVVPFNYMIVDDNIVVTDIEETTDIGYKNSNEVTVQEAIGLLKDSNPIALGKCLKQLTLLYLETAEYVNLKEKGV